MNISKKLAKLAFKNPRLAINKIKITFRNKITAKLDYHFKNGYSSPPSTICIKLTNACNLRCKMCGQPREGHKKGDPKYAPPSFFKEKIPLGTFQQVIDEVKSFRPNLYLWGGEPFLYHEIFDLIAYARSHKITCQINTNGLYLNKFATQIVDSGLDDLIVSIDGPQKVHDQVRGLNGSFNLIKKGILAINDQKKRRGVKYPVIRIRGTISPYNFEYIYSLVEIAKQFEADSLNFNWTWFFSQQTGMAYQKVMKEVFDTEAVSWIPYESDVILDPEKLKKYDGIKQELLKFKNNSTDIPISMSPFIKPDQVKTYYENIYETFGSDTCFSIYTKSYILPNGDVTPCPDFPDYICGNIIKEKFTDIWNGERYRKWRLELKKRKLIPSCYRCCDLYLSNVKFM